MALFRYPKKLKKIPSNLNKQAVMLNINWFEKQFRMYKKKKIELINDLNVNGLGRWKMYFGSFLWKGFSFNLILQLLHSLIRYTIRPSFSIHSINFSLNWFYHYIKFMASNLFYWFLSAFLWATSMSAVLSIKIYFLFYW